MRSPIAWSWWLGTNDKRRRARGQAQRVAELGAAEGALDDFRLQLAGVVVDHVVRPQQEVHERAGGWSWVSWPSMTPSSVATRPGPTTVPGMKVPSPTKSATKRVFGE